MVQLYEEGIYLVNGTEIVPESQKEKVEGLTGKRQTGKKTGKVPWLILL